MYEMLYGYTPFRGKTRQKTFTNVLHKDLKFPGSIPVSFSRYLVSLIEEGHILFIFYGKLSRYVPICNILVERTSDVTGKSTSKAVNVSIVAQRSQKQVGITGRGK